MFQFQKIINLNIKCLHLDKQVDCPTLSSHDIYSKCCLQQTTHTVYEITDLGSCVLIYGRDCYLASWWSVDQSYFIYIINLVYKTVSFASKN